MEKKQTVEEAAILNCQSITHPYCDREKLMFIKGAEWQAKQMYSKDELADLIDATFQGRQDVADLFSELLKNLKTK
jgi:hypothetical protein